MKVEGHATRIVGFALLIGSAVISSQISSPWHPRIDSTSVEAQQAPEGHQVVLLAPIERDIVKQEMRTMLRSLSLILQGLAVSDLEMVEQAARVSGKAAAIDRELARKLPTHFVELCTESRNGDRDAGGSRRAGMWRWQQANALSERGGRGLI